MGSALILVVDDDADVRELAAATLKRAGYRILEAGDGDKAFKLLDGNPDIQLMFTDIVMPGVDGFKLADMAKVRRPEIKILYTTGYVHAAETKLGVVHGRILPKPYRPTQLEDMVRQALGLSET